MRSIGQLPSEETANRFSDFLYVKGISNLVELDMDKWVIWIHSEDELEKAKDLLNSFLGNPNDPEVVANARRAAALRAKEEAETVAEQEEREAKHVHLDRSTIVAANQPGLGRMTLALVMICIGVAVLTGLGSDNSKVSGLYISEFVTKTVPEVRAGQVWRLITPIFVHGDGIHLLFNVLWLVFLGGRIEARFGAFKLVLMVAVLAILSNLGQNFYSGPLFCGMSGVNYGLLGYIWIKGRFDPWSGLYIQPQVMLMMMIWFFVCFTGAVGNVANVAHAVGLAAGLAWGYLSCIRASRS